MRIGLRQLPSDKNLSSTVERKPLRCRLGNHCRHPRVVTKNFMDHAGNEWSKKVLEHDDNGQYIQIRTADEPSVAHVTDHKGNWTIFTSKWKMKCCRCDNIKWWIETYKTHDILKNRGLSKKL